LIEPVVFKYLTEMGRQNATDLYLTIGVPPTLRVDDNLVPISNKPMDAVQMNDILSNILTTRQRRDFEMKMELNSAIDLGEHGRFRINIFQQRLQVGLVIRRIISRIPTFEELRLPKILEKLSLTKRGLILLTGMTGSGKTTTLASMLDYRNSNSYGHILTIEDPIEYYHDHKMSVITQREVGVDTEGYSIALKNALRQRPDVILVGEIRDRDVMEQALTASETGHLCLSTIHTNNAYQAIERIVNMFPEEGQSQIRNNLAMNLRAIISQRLVRTINGGLAVALEIMLNEGLVKDLISEGKINKFPEIMGANETAGMVTFDQSLIHLYEEGVISEEMAISQSDMPSDMRLKIQKIKIGGQTGGLSSLDTSVLKISE